jgi:hypothetical protein
MMLKGVAIEAVEERFFILLPFVAGHKRGVAMVGYGVPANGVGPLPVPLSVTI